MKFVQSETRNPVDWTALLESMGGDQEILEEMARLFVEFAPTQVRDLEDALASVDPEAVRSAAHRLKGSLSQFGLGQPTEQAARIEELAREEDLEQASGLLPALLEEIRLLLIQLERWLES